MNMSYCVKPIKESIELYSKSIVIFRGKQTVFVKVIPDFHNFYISWTLWPQTGSFDNHPQDSSGIL